MSQEEADDPQKADMTANASATQNGVKDCGAHVEHRESEPCPSVRELAKSCAQNSVAHGIPRLVNFNSPFELLFWTVAVIGGLTGFSVHAGSMLMEFLSDSSVSTNVQFGDQQVPFPHVTVCNRLPFLSAYHEQFYRGVWPNIPPECSKTPGVNGEQLRAILQVLMRLEQAQPDSTQTKKNVESTWLKQRQLDSAVGNYTRVLWELVRDTYGKRCLAKLFEVPTEQLVLDCSVGGVDCSPANLRVDTVWHPQYLSCKKFQVKEVEEQVASLQMTLFLNSFAGFEDTKAAASKAEPLPRAFQHQDLSGTGAQDEDDFPEPGAVVLLSAPNRSLGAGVSATFSASADQEEAPVHLAPGQEAKVFARARQEELLNRRSQVCESRPVVPVWNSLTERLEPLHQRREDCQVQVFHKHLRVTSKCAPGGYEVARSQPDQLSHCMSFPDDVVKLGQMHELKGLRGSALVTKLSQSEVMQQLIARSNFVSRKEHVLLRNMRRKMGAFRPTVVAAAAAERSLRQEALRGCVQPCQQLHYTHQTQVTDWPSAAALERVSNYVLRQVQPTHAQEQFQSRSLARMHAQVVEHRNMAYFKRNTAKFTVRLSRSGSLKVTEGWSKSSLAFLADVGGALGLWIGISAVCLCELLYFFICALKMKLLGEKIKTE